eukprot:CAMPEP_0114993920 /NCGR_PEP_ID=MMETSP0216-20121206/12817_1 /TAXON_ID=223996 /ORGANISM="Protocruzia adherens, Strain Boccale" /LENGTH=250 /DNA_ID=CAMNT_0002357655 /DNA_START=195 /DNA_END=947 /DNA_ORIENTATION=-
MRLYRHNEKLSILQDLEDEIESCLSIQDEEENPITFVPSGIEREDLIMIKGAALHDESSTEWALCVENEETKTKVYRYTLGRSRPELETALLMTTDIPLHPKEVFDHFNDTTKLTKWDSQMAECYLVDNYRGYELYYSRIKFPFPFADRGFLTRKFTQSDVENDFYVIVMTSEGTEEYKFEPKTSVQMAHTYIAAIIIQAINCNGEQHTRLKMLNQSDLKGSIPSYLLDVVGPKVTLAYCDDVRRGLGVK